MPATEQTWYNQKRMHRLFAISSLVLLGATIWMLAKDNDRPWKDYQETAMQMDVAYGRWDEIRANAELNASDLAELEAELLVAQGAIPGQGLMKSFKDAINHDAREREVSESQASAIIARIDSAYAKVLPPEQGFQNEQDQAAWQENAPGRRSELISVLAAVIGDAKFRENYLLDTRKMKSAQYDAAKSQVDLAVRDDKPLKLLQAKADEVKAELDELTRQYQHASGHRTKLQETLEEITADERATQKEIDDIKKEVAQIAASVDERRSTWFMSKFPWLGKKWVEAPILNAFNSPKKIENLWTEGLTHNYYNFKPVLRYDRCTTCHQSMQKTQKGLPLDPLFPLVHQVTFKLDTPSQAEIDTLTGQVQPNAEGGGNAAGQIAKAEDANPSPKLTLNSVYGFLIAADGSGLMHRDDITVSFVDWQSRANKARMVGDEAGVKYLSQQIIQQSLSAALPPDAPPPEFGLMVGDVILEVNGSRVLNNGDVRRMLLESVTWGQPVDITVRRGYPHPYVTHPRLDLYIGSSSPHGMQTYGCTICHEGQGSATSFEWASHTPNTVKQREQWAKEQGWFDNHHWIYPMHPQRFVESSCVKCHHEVVELEPSERFPEPPAPKLMSGYNTVRRYGCFGCHEIVGYDGPDKRIGPDMRLEPNYFAAGLQLAYLAEVREKGLTDQIAKASGDEKEQLQADLEEIHLSLADVKRWGQTLGTATYDNEVRHRLQELVNGDQDNYNRVNTAAQTDELVKETYVPLFVDPAAAYDAAAVLKDDEMPGTFRKVGPSLRYVASKLAAPFMDDWIHEPKHFRPSTRMPQFFGLYNHFQDDKEEVNHTEALEKVEVQGIRSYLLAYSQPFDPLEGGTKFDAENDGQHAQVARGKLLFEVNGCLACHSNKDFPGHGDQGPDLSGLASKLVGEKGRKWLYGWIQNPKRYHARTKMPVVHLKPLPKVAETDPNPEDTDPIADVVAYLLSEKRSGWQPYDPEGTPDANRLDELTLMHLSKTFSTSFAEEYLKTGIKQTRRNTLKGAEVELLVPDASVDAGKPLSQEQKLRYVGAKSVGKYGCYACHDIPGFEGAKPIGTALSDWGRKDPAKLAFEHIDHYVGHGHAAHGGDHGAEASSESSHVSPEDNAYYAHELHDHTRIGFIYQKLKEPRSFDFDKIKNKPYNDRLRMPQFPLDHDQREQVITFVLGLVASPPAEEFVYAPSPRQEAINQGRVVLDQFNCAGCHELSREDWTITFPEGWDRIREPDKPLRFPFLFPHVTEAEIEQSEFVSRSARQTAALIGRVKRKDRGQLDIYVFDKDEEDFIPASPTAEKLPVDKLAFRFELYQPTLIAGNLHMPKEMSPTIPVENLQRRQAAVGGDLATYLLPRVLELNGEINRTKGEEAWGWVPPSLVGEGKKVQPQWLHSFLLEPHPIRPAVMLNMPKFNMSPDEATKLVNYFAATDSAEFPYDFDRRQQSSHLAAAAASYQKAVAALPPAERDLFTGNRFDDAMRIVLDKGTGCAKCHSVDDYVSEGDPRSKGPNLANVYKRLRPTYTRNWIAYPWYTLPYTAMPENFKYNPTNPEADGFAVKNLYHGDSTQQLDGVVDVLMNFDKYAEGQISIAEKVPNAAPPAAGGEKPAEGDTPAQTDEIKENQN